MSNGSPNFCSKCGAELIKNSRFCSTCGTAVSFKKKISGLTNRLIHSAQNSIESFKTNLDGQISQYLTKFENNENVAIGSINIPDSRRDAVENAMRSFQNKYFGGSPEQTAEYEAWVADLPNRLEEHKCVICFSSWNIDDKDDIIVCPFCSTGGHRSHIENWIKSKQYCPLCRENVKFADFIKLV